MSKPQEGYDDMGGQSAKVYHDNLHIEPIFEAFICPLTKKLMQDPVILENGRTFEHDAIKKWLSDCQNNGRKILCPLSLEELSNTYLIPNVALRNTIEEWNQRNEAAKLNLAHFVLSPGCSEEDALHALTYIQEKCTENRYYKHFVRNAKMIPRIVDKLWSSSGNIQCKALETLRMVVEDDADNKEVVAAGDTICMVVKFLIRDCPQEKHEAVSLLNELSKSESLSQKIGEVNGAILILVGMACSKTQDESTVQKAEKTLENMEKCEKNVLQMAENGRLQPLLRLLLEGSPEMQLAMASYLGELVLSNDLKVLVAKNAGSSLVNLMINGSKEEKATAVKALNQISSYETSANLLIEVGILPPLVRDLLTIGHKELSMSLKETSANVLANIITNCAHSASISLGQDHKTLVSEEMVHNLLHLISNTGPAMECKLIEILVGLTCTPTSTQSIVIAIKSSGAAINLVQFIEAPQRDLQRASLKLLHNISPYMHQELITCLCDSAGYLNKLIDIISETSVVLEEQLAAIGILAELPDEDANFTRCLLHEKAFDAVLSQVYRIRRGETLGNRVAPYLEGLTRVLAKLVYSFESGPPFIRDNNLAALFTDMLHTNGNDNVIVVSAMALKILSQKSKHFVRAVSSNNRVTRWGKKKPSTTSFCLVHRGVCLMKENFCLIDGKAVERLISCLDHANKEVVEAALAALCTLLMDDVDIEQGVLALKNANAIKPIMQMLQDNRSDVLQQKSVWAVERMLRTEEIARDASIDPNINGALRQAYQRGDTQTRHLAEQALKHINMIPNFSVISPRVE